MESGGSSSRCVCPSHAPGKHSLAVCCEPHTDQGPGAAATEKEAKTLPLGRLSAGKGGFYPRPPVPGTRVSVQGGAPPRPLCSQERLHLTASRLRPPACASGPANQHGWSRGRAQGPPRPMRACPRTCAGAGGQGPPPLPRRAHWVMKGSLEPPTAALPPWGGRAPCLQGEGNAQKSRAKPRKKTPDATGSTLGSSKT